MASHRRELRGSVGRHEHRQRVGPLVGPLPTVNRVLAYRQAASVQGESGRRERAAPVADLGRGRWFQLELGGAAGRLWAAVQGMVWIHDLRLERQLFSEVAAPAAADGAAAAPLVPLAASASG